MTPPTPRRLAAIATAAIAAFIAAAALTAAVSAYYPYFWAKWTTDAPTSENDPQVRQAAESPETATLWEPLLAAWTAQAGSEPHTPTDLTGDTVQPVCFELAPTPDYRPDTPFVECHQVAEAQWVETGLTRAGMVRTAEQLGWHTTVYPGNGAAKLARDGRTIMLSVQPGSDGTATVHADLIYQAFPPPPPP